MTETPVPMHVFLDTEVFDSVGLNLTSRDFMRLLRFVRAGRIELVSTIVTEREIESHLEEKVAAVVAACEKAKRLASGVARVSDSAWTHLNAIDVEKVAEDFSSARSSYIEAAKPTVIDVSDVDLSLILDQYFTKKPPFGDGKKKSEFPDAIAGAALQNWCREHGRSLHIVGKDGDWEKLCAETECFTYHKRLIDVFKLIPDPDLAEQVCAALRSNTTLIEETVKHNFPICADFMIDEVDGEVIEVLVDAVDFIAFNVVESTSTAAVVEVDCEVTFTAQVTYKDPASWIYDSEDKVAIYMESIDRELESEYEMTVEVNVSFPIDEEHLLSVDSVDVSWEDYITLSTRDDEY